MSNEKYVIRAGQTAHDEYALDLSPETAGWEWSSLRVVALEAGASVEIPGGEAEFLVLPLQGGCTVEVQGRGSILLDAHQCSRTSPITSTSRVTPIFA